MAHVTADPDPAPALLTIPAAAGRLSVGRTTVYGLLTNGQLPSVKVGRLRRIPADALDAYVARLPRAGAA